ncbi:MAG: MFS transporter [Mycolicibacterium insubricum]|jgi:MFS family permease|uniref:MFS transporter n=1 Tax=Mycolicibacterium insubricum TaxID=444597 RepID=A0A1X0DH89_9MYCO|nr:MFS transporter [Mycolicibacterium insubricum]MCB9441525.1 MFS transporter [Mycolicibacterium sp.]MCV7083703.1 MFS transporter [Mycolicibacterium insubricum]ORA71529.1 MFS transporter [Mycolicibacterium insubricum]
MAGAPNSAEAGPGTWGELLSRRYLGACIVLAGGVALYATNEFLTVSLLPSTVAEIGGQRLYAWVTSVYLVASVAAATTVGGLLARYGPRRAYLIALAVFGAGSLLCAGAQTMELLLAGRGLQGIGGGVLAGLGYAVINAALPPSLWTRGSALVSAMWGVGCLVGPAAGGFFAQIGQWRWAFGVLVILTVLMALVVPWALPAGRRAGAAARTEIPVRSLLLLGVAALAISAAGLPDRVEATAALLAVGMALVAVFVVLDRRARVSVLPATAFRPGPLKWMYLTLGLLMAATMVDMFVPLFAHRLAGLTPLAAGFLAAGLSVGWTGGELISAIVDRRAVSSRIVALAPALMALGLTLAALTQRVDAGPRDVAAWVVALVVTGAGVGIAWPHLSAWVMGAVDDPDERTVAAAAINTVQLICGAFGAGLAGVVVNLTDDGGAAPARWLFGVFAVLALLGLTASVRAARR